MRRARVLIALSTHPLRRRAAHSLAAWRRRLARQRPTVHYFHQVDDPYSHLAVQKLPQLLASYQVACATHLVSPPAAADLGDAQLQPHWALRDAVDIAPFHEVDFPAAAQRPATSQIVAAQRVQASVIAAPELFCALAIETGRDLWSGKPISTAEALAEDEVATLLARGDALRKRLRQYAGAMFYFEGEWYWGLDRLHYLEKRLRALGLCTSPNAPLVAPLVVPESATGAGASAVVLEYFPSLRSPYTAISYDLTMDLVDRAGVDLRIKPVLPMMMRGVPASFAKQFYIITDAKREADRHGVPFGPVADPMGEPVRRAFSLYPWLQTQPGALRSFCGSYLRAAWQEGIDISVDAGLRKVVERAGLPWARAREHLDKPGWTGALEDHVAVLRKEGLWGVPSFRVLAPDGHCVYSGWGQDRLWRVETAIARLASRNDRAPPARASNAEAVP